MEGGKGVVPYTPYSAVDSDEDVNDLESSAYGVQDHSSSSEEEEEETRRNETREKEEEKEDKKRKDEDVNDLESSAYGVQDGSDGSGGENYGGVSSGSEEDHKEEPVNYHQKNDNESGGDDDNYNKANSGSDSSDNESNKPQKDKGKAAPSLVYDSGRIRAALYRSPRSGEAYANQRVSPRDGRGHDAYSSQQASPRTFDRSSARGSAPQSPKKSTHAHATSTRGPSAVARDWMAEYVALSGKLLSNASDESGEGTFRVLADLFIDFAQCASDIGKLIIQELNLGIVYLSASFLPLFANAAHRAQNDRAARAGRRCRRCQVHSPGHFVQVRCRCSA